MIAGRPSPFGARPSPLAHRRSPLFVAYPLLFILILRLKINTWLLCKGSMALYIMVNATKGLFISCRSSGGESSIVAELVETEDNATHQMQTIRTPPIITVNKSAAYALYEITYIRDVPFKAEEHSVRTRKCEPDASAKIVKSCERLKDQSGRYIEKTKVSSTHAQYGPLSFALLKHGFHTCGPILKLPCVRNFGS
ncbi:hypothetical protein H6P81_003329 [Aristolochia fimbriata]|uniref:Generative cell specific-1/HAP2 domain-containing protein n=1 Tax=Aristolochia fimbriata TaxID=158543 RepID=A0AAV7FG58_ARIFI|nr:hypothetical protein H6P81_003329 [Aristolochia fimbriata]